MHLLLLLACAGTPSHELASASGLLAPCPSSPNCVSSLADPGDGTHYIRPLLDHGATPADLDRVAALVQAEPRTELLSRTDTALHATFTSALFRFVDDVEVVLEGDVLHVRSASRVGHGDLGVNRERVERLRQGLQAG